MQLYARQGWTDFVLCLGYKGDIIRDYFLNYHLRNCDVTVTLGSSALELHSYYAETGWRVTLAETGDKTMTGGRLKRVARYITEDRFMATYGDAVANVDLRALLDTHIASGKLATVTAVRPSSRFGELLVQDGLVRTFEEKPQVSNSWINGGFFVFEKQVLDFIRGDDDTLEKDLLIKLAEANELAVYQHSNFWQCMDTLRESELLNKLWNNGNAPWTTISVSGSISMRSPTVMQNGVALSAANNNGSAA
jgi:glucose-1-phosphate cytidylyltransferase